MEIAIFGAGIAGLMTAIAMRAQGHRCRVYERHPGLHEAGMGFILMPEGIHCLQSFGVELTGALHGRLLDRYCCRDAEGQVLYEQAMPPGARGIRRRDLVEALLSTWLSDGAIRFSAGLDSLHFDASDRATAAWLMTDTGVERVTADLYVGADGVTSRAKEALFPGWPMQPFTVRELIGLVSKPDVVSWAGDNFNKLHAPCGGIAIGIVPVDAEHVIWYIQFDEDLLPLLDAPPVSRRDINVSDRGGVARFDFAASLAGDWAEPVPSLFAATDFRRVYPYRSFDSDLIPQFYRGNVVLVGDAAHPLSSFTSQGVSSAVTDAVVLAREIGAGEGSHEGLIRALAHYSSERREQCAPYIDKGRAMTRSFLAPLDVNNLVLPLA